MAKLIACRACGNQVSTEAKACPQCGAPRKRRRVGLIALGVVGGLIVIGAAAGGTKDRERARSDGSSPASAATSPAEAPAAAISVSAEQLRKDYKTNEVSADERYRGKPLLVTGTVKSIKKDILDNPYVELSTSEMFENVDAHFADGATAALGKLAPGNKITVSCVGNNVVIGSPQLKDCSLQ